MDSKRYLSVNDIEELFNDEQFWNDNIENQTTDAPLPVFDKMTTEADKSDQEESDNEFESDHDSQSEFSDSSNDQWGPDEEESEECETENIPDANTTTSEKKRVWHGKDRTIWAKQGPIRRKTPACNLTRFLPGLAGGAKQNPPSNALEAWKLLISDEMLGNIVECTNKKIDQMSVAYTTTKQCRPSFISKTDLIEIKAFIGLLYLQGIFKSNHEDLRSLWNTDGTGRDIFNSTMTLARFYFLLSCLRFDDQDTRSERRAISKLAPIQEIFEEFLSRSTNS